MMGTEEKRLLVLGQEITFLQARATALEATRNTSSIPTVASILSTDFGTLQLMQSRQGPLYEQRGRVAPLSTLCISSADWLYYHLKELLADGLIEQKSRNLYTLPARNIIPLLVLLAVAFDTTGKD